MIIQCEQTSVIFVLFDAFWGKTTKRVDMK